MDIKQLKICDLDIDVNYVSKEALNELYKDSVVERKDNDLCGLADIKKLIIYIDKDMHDFQMRKTLVHEAGHLLIAINNEIIEQITEINFHEMLAIFVSENSKQIADIHNQVYQNCQ